MLTSLAVAGCGYAIIYDDVLGRRRNWRNNEVRRSWEVTEMSKTVNVVENRVFLPLTKEEVHVLLVSVCLFVCLLARLLKNACMDLDEMWHVDRCRNMDELIKL